MNYYDLFNTRVNIRKATKDDFDCHVYSYSVYPDENNIPLIENTYIILDEININKNEINKNEINKNEINKNEINKNEIKN